MPLENHSKNSRHLDFHMFVAGSFMCSSKKVELVVEMKVKGGREM